MKFVSYSVGGEPFRGGLSVNGQVVDLADGASAIGASLPSNVVDVLQLGEEALAIAHKVARGAADGDIASLPEASVVLGAAVQNPPTIYLLAGNYQSHIVEGGGAAVDKAKIKIGRAHV